MPRFLESALRHEAAKKGFTGKRADRYVFGAMNNLGAVRGNKETAKGREMEKKHMADTKMESSMKKTPFRMTHITHHPDGSHTVEHEPHTKMGKGGAFIERPESTSYSAPDGKQLVAKMTKHLGIGAAPSPKTEEAELEPSEPTGGHEEGEYESDEEGE
jgi:hypothetical protein